MEVLHPDGAPPIAAGASDGLSPTGPLAPQSTVCGSRPKCVAAARRQLCTASGMMSGEFTLSRGEMSPMSMPSGSDTEVDGEAKKEPAEASEDQHPAAEAAESEPGALAPPIGHADEDIDKGAPTPPLAIGDVPKPSPPKRAASSAAGSSSPAPHAVSTPPPKRQKIVKKSPSNKCCELYAPQPTDAATP
ncbi:unnamed protein product, partial [Prorocentrum cordatum]